MDRTAPVAKKTTTNAPVAGAYTSVASSMDAGRSQMLIFPPSCTSPIMNSYGDPESKMMSAAAAIAQSGAMARDKNRLIDMLPF
jgi:hypothetical protein